MNLLQAKDDIETIETNYVSDEEASENVILDYPSRGRERILSKYSILTYRTFSREFETPVIIIIFLTTLMLGMTIGAITIRFFGCKDDEHNLPNTFEGNRSDPISHL